MYNSEVSVSQFHCQTRRYFSVHSSHIPVVRDSNSLHPPFLLKQYHESTITPFKVLIILLITVLF